MTTYQIPQVEGDLTPEESQAWLDSMDNAPNLAGHEVHGPRALKFTQNIIAEWRSRMWPLSQRWRLNYYMLMGNTLASSGPEDVHVPELYKAVETIVPRVEEQILERDPWFKVVPRNAKYKAVASTVAAYMDWQFDQARIRDTVQAAARNMLITQCATWYLRWENLFKTRRVREEKKEWTKDGRMKRSVTVTAKKQLAFAGMKATLVDPFDFIIDTKATNPQEATYVGHRIWLTIDEVRRLGQIYGWQNLGKELDALQGAKSDYDVNTFSWPRDPTSWLGEDSRQNARRDGRPDRIELLILYSKFDAYDIGEYEDYQFIVSGGKVLHEFKRNQHDNDLRPYATARVTNNGHEFYGVGPLDNAVRINQHLDRYHQIVLRGSEVAASPFVFASEDSDLPDSLYKVRPFQVYKGVGDVRFSTVPDGFLQAAPVIIGMLQRNIEETVGAFKIQMGQDLTGGTATEATLSLQEGNRRNRSIIRGLAGGLEQVLNIGYQLVQQNSMQDVEFPVLGKRALDLKRDHAIISPADLLSDVKFDLVGLHNTRTYGMRAAGLQLIANSMGPFIMQNPGVVDQPKLIYKFVEEQLGTEEADEIVNLPTPIENLHSQDEENEGLIQGAEIEVDDDDPHQDHIEKMEDLWQSVLRGEKGYDVRKAVLKHRGQHVYMLQQQQAQQKAQQQRSQEKRDMMAPEAGGQAGETGQSPVAGGMSNAMTSMVGGQTKGETPGPQDPMKQPRPGGIRRPMAQTDNTAMP